MQMNVCGKSLFQATKQQLSGEIWAVGYLPVLYIYMLYMLLKNILPNTGRPNNVTKLLNQKQISILHLIFHHLSFLSVLFSLQKGLTWKSAFCHNKPAFLLTFQVFGSYAPGQHFWQTREAGTKWNVSAGISSRTFQMGSPVSSPCWEISCPCHWFNQSLFWDLIGCRWQSSAEYYTSCLPVECPMMSMAKYYTSYLLVECPMMSTAKYYTSYLPVECPMMFTAKYYTSCLPVECPTMFMAKHYTSYLLAESYTSVANDYTSICLQSVTWPPAWM